MSKRPTNSDQSFEAASWLHSDTRRPSSPESHGSRGTLSRPQRSSRQKWRAHVFCGRGRFLPCFPDRQTWTGRGSHQHSPRGLLNGYRRNGPSIPFSQLAWRAALSRRRSVPPSHPQAVACVTAASGFPGHWPPFFLSHRYNQSPPLPLSLALVLSLNIVEGNLRCGQEFLENGSRHERD